MRVIGIDSGSSHFAYCALDIEQSKEVGNRGLIVRRVPYLFESVPGSKVIDVGRDVQRAHPKRTRSGRVLTTKHVVDQDSLNALYSQLRPLLERARAGHPRIMLAVERRCDVTPRAGGITSSMATELKAAAETGMIAWTLARSLGYITDMASPDEWRASLCGSRKATDALIGAAVPLAVQDWPKRSNAHERDAAGVALFCGRREVIAHSKELHEEERHRQEYDERMRESWPGHGAG